LTGGTIKRRMKKFSIIWALCLIGCVGIPDNVAFGAGGGFERATENVRQIIMKARIHIITLGVKDCEASVCFYDHGLAVPRRLVKAAQHFLNYQDHGCLFIPRAHWPIAADFIVDSNFLTVVS